MTLRRIAAAAWLAATLAVPAAAQTATSHHAAEAPAGVAAPAPAFRIQEKAAQPAAIVLPAPDPAAIQALREANARSKTKRVEIGIGRALSEAAVAASFPWDGARSESTARWIVVPGGRAAQWQVTSQGAAALRLGLRVMRLSAGSELRFAGGARPGVVYGPITAHDAFAMGDTYWSPVLEGETGTVELFVPDGGEASFAFASLSHVFASPSDPRAESLAKAIGDSGSCEVDLICRSTGDAALAQTGRSVARMTFTAPSGGSAMCTGTLLNPTDNSFTPYFYSAAHCISTQASASTLTTHWFYDSTACGADTPNPANVQVPGGATLVFANTATDVLFMRLNAQPPPNAVYAGWNAATVTGGTPATAVHHPMGDLKKVSLGTIAGFETLNGASYIRVNWNSLATGVVEQGSSGSGIFTSSASGYQFRGGLRGGPSSCIAPPSALYDQYSRFDQAFPSIQQYLTGVAPPQPNGPNVVANPGFESGRTAWTETSGQGLAIITNDAANSRSGAWHAWLGGVASATDLLAQQVTVPGAPVELRFWYRIGTAEATTVTPFDELTVTVQSTGGATLATLATLSNLDATAGWVQSPAYDLSAFSGQSVRLVFAASNDFSETTSFRIDDVTLVGTVAASGANHTGLYYNPSESGWGINVTHQGDIAFATLFTYDTDGAPLWLVMSNGARQGSGDVFTGALFRTNGPAFNTSPWPGFGFTQVGTMTLSFSGGGGTLAYNVGNAQVNKAMQKQIAATCTSTSGSRAGATNYTDLWYNAPAESEPGWGINLAQQGQQIFATLFTYDASARNAWYVMDAGLRQGDGSYLGTLYRTNGPVFNAQPWTGIGFEAVGTMRLRFQNGENATLEYTIGGTPVTKQVTRQQFSSPLPLCSG